MYLRTQVHLNYASHVHQSHARGDGGDGVKSSPLRSVVGGISLPAPCALVLRVLCVPVVHSVLALPVLCVPVVHNVPALHVVVLLHAFRNVPALHAVALLPTARAYSRETPNRDGGSTRPPWLVESLQTFPTLVC